MLFYDKNIPLSAEFLHTAGPALPFDGRMLCNQDLISHGCTALLVRSVTKVNRELLHNTKVNFVATATAGTDHIDRELLRQQDIFFSAAPGCNADAVTEYVLYALLYWQQMLGIDLHAICLGIIGLGNVGARVALAAHTMGITVMGTDPPKEKQNKFLSFVQYMPASEILQQCNCITNHIPFDTNTIDILPQSQSIQNTLFIHASRGKIMNEPALLHGMHTKNWYAAIDVWSNEPLWNQALSEHPNCLMATPHCAGYTEQARLNGAHAVEKAWLKFHQKEADYLSVANTFTKQYTAADYALLYKALAQQRFTSDRMKILSQYQPDAMLFDTIRREFMHDKQCIQPITIPDTYLGVEE
jgi:erythronate-4-phosphate dehydrogenase